MSFWPFKGRRQKKKKNKNTTYQFNFLGTILELQPTSSATQEKRKQKEQASDSQAVSQPDEPINDPVYQRWIALSYREQQIIALTCLSYTNPQIASCLYLSINTIKTHLERILFKFGLRSKADLRVVFANWDFSEWVIPLPVD
jgi:DNA-binding CsgD family transcriptional regulator